jgi:hypothetical protein
MTPHHPLPPVPLARVELADLYELAQWLPPTAATLVRVLGPAAALALLQAWPGVTYPIPRHPDANANGARRWAALADVVGEAAMPALAAHWGGSALDVPVCRALLAQKRNTWIRAQFDVLVNPTGAAMSGNAAAQAISLALAQAGQPMTHRELERLINQPDDINSPPGGRRAQGQNPKQLDLFENN